MELLLTKKIVVIEIQEMNTTCLCLEVRNDGLDPSWTPINLFHANYKEFGRFHGKNKNPMLRWIREDKISITLPNGDSPDLNGNKSLEIEDLLAITISIVLVSVLRVKLANNSRKETCVLLWNELGLLRT
jgi:hypothetical protein